MKKRIVKKANTKITIKEMCDTIVKADILRRKDGTVPNAHEIYMSSVTGELYQIFIWYRIALEQSKHLPIAQ